MPIKIHRGRNIANLFFMKILKKNLISAMSSTSISMQIRITLKNIDSRYIEIRCVVKGKLVGNVFSLSLKSLHKNTTSVSKYCALEYIIIII